ncbi:cytochrome C oxidase subunit IV family protein [Actinomycetospora sp.]|uniref:cytochrome C oxidase subunit IV family protein n=1 Tax=Actinomycetospora sp. TaxID=1872135 RepID=UPI002F41E5B8
MTVLRERVTLVWVGLVAATCASTWLLAKDLLSPAVGTVGIFVIAAFKVRYVMLDFMELRDAPIPARVISGVWTVAVTLLILGFWFVTAAS